MTIRKWLRTDYSDIADLIDDVMAEIQASGSRERRNWWVVLAGGDGGAPLMVAGRVFPVLRAAQIRQGKPTTPNAICRNEDEVPPGVRATKRWPRRRLPTKTSRSGLSARRRRPMTSAKVG